MKVCFLTTWLPKSCGIGTYTNYLSKGLLKDKNITIDIITEKENSPVKGERINVHPCFDRISEYDGDILSKIEEIGPDVVHIQHEFGIFGNDFRIVNLLEKIKTKKVVTLHTLSVNYLKPKFPEVEAFNNLIVKASDKVIVHQRADKSVLSRQSSDEGKISVIAHGTEIMQNLDQMESRKKLGWREDIKILLLFGFLKKAKLCFPFVQALPSIFKSNPDVYLYIVGSTCQSSEKEKPYFDRIKEELKEQGIADRVVFIDEFIPQEKVPLYYNAADIVVMPYDLTEWGASGALHLAIGSGKPTIISRIAKADEIRENISEEITPLLHKKGEWSRVVNRILADKEFREYIINRTKQYAEKTSWENIAKEHFELYQSLSG